MLILLMTIVITITIIITIMIISREARLAGRNPCGWRPRARPGRRLSAVQYYVSCMTNVSSISSISSLSSSSSSSEHIISSIISVVVVVVVVVVVNIYMYTYLCIHIYIYTHTLYYTIAWCSQQYHHVLNDRRRLFSKHGLATGSTKAVRMSRQMLRRNHIT